MRVEAAIFNVRINLGSIKDQDYVQNIETQLTKLTENTKSKTNHVLKIVEGIMK